MQIILILRDKGAHRLPWRQVIALGLLLLMVGIALSQLWLRYGQPVLGAGMQAALQHWQAALAQQSQQVEQAALQADYQVQALSIAVAELQARLQRLDALGERLVDQAGLNTDEFDFSTPPALGGPGLLLPQQGEHEGIEPVFTSLDDLAQQIDQRQQQLTLLERVLEGQRWRADTEVAGRPINKGWISSYYGWRNDPFTGQRAWHQGVDLAGREGGDIIAVASGVVTFAGERFGYGLMVELNHSNGLVTRYAHAKALQVSVGDVVKKGQTIALLGSTGRSTGPHVHFEVYKQGKPVDPLAYLQR